MMKFLNKTLRFVLRQGPFANLEEAKITAHKGELHWTTDTERLYISSADGGDPSQDMLEIAMITDLDPINSITANRLLGRVDTNGSVQEISLGSNLDFTGSILNSINTTYTASDFDISDLSDSLNKRINWDLAYSWGDHSTENYLKTESDPIFTSHVSYNITEYDISEWNTSYNHTLDSTIHFTMNSISITESQISNLGNYITSESDPIFTSSPSYNITEYDILNWDESYNHTLDNTIHFTMNSISITESQISDLQNYLLSETDPIFNAHVASDIISTDISNWNAAHEWGDHSLENYLKTESDPIFTSHPSYNITEYNISEWDDAYNNIHDEITIIGENYLSLINQQITANKITKSNFENITANRILGRLSTDGTIQELSNSDIRTFINVEDGANNYTHPNHTGDITSVGDGATTIANNVVTDEKFRQSTGFSVVGRSVTGTGNISDIIAGSNGVLRRNSTGNLEFGTIVAGNIASNAITTAKILSSTSTTTGVTYAKMQYVTANRLLGRVSTNGIPQEISLGSNLSFDGTTLNSENTTYTASDFDIKDLSDSMNKRINWDAAYGWGDHSLANYLTSVALNDISNVTITSPATDQILKFNGTSWVNWTPDYSSASVSLTQHQIAFGDSNNEITSSSNLTFNNNILNVDSQNSTSRGFGANQVSFSVVDGTWYTIATVQGASANAMFEVWDTMHSRRGVVRFTASQAQPHNSSPEQNTNLTVFGSAAHTGEGGIDGIRIRAGQWSTHVSYLQVQATGDGTIHVAMSDNRSSGGWTLVAGTSTGNQGYQTTAYVSTNQYPGFYASRNSLFDQNLTVGGNLTTVGDLNLTGDIILGIPSSTNRSFNSDGSGLFDGSLNVNDTMSFTKMSVLTNNGITTFNVSSNISPSNVGTIIKTTDTLTITFTSNPNGRMFFVWPESGTATLRFDSNSSSSIQEFKSVAVTSTGAAVMYNGDAQEWYKFG